MSMSNIKIIHISLLLLGIIMNLTSCSTHPTEKELDQSDLNFIQNIGLLEQGEEIELFSCNGGFSGIEQSGNFISDRRIAGYWIEGEEKEIHSAFFANDIDSIQTFDRSSALTHASSIRVFKSDKSQFEIFIDGDNDRVNAFFTKARNNLSKYRNSR